jgi:hypothetical protein
LITATFKNLPGEGVKNKRLMNKDKEIQMKSARDNVC